MVLTMLVPYQVFAEKIGVHPSRGWQGTGPSCEEDKTVPPGDR